MPDVIKEEIRRIARREANALTKRLRKDNTALKRSNAGLRRRVAALEKTVSRQRAVAAEWQKRTLSVGEDQLQGLRIRKDTVKSLRKRLRLTQGEFAQLAGVSLPTVRNWETGTLPRDQYKATLAGLRKLNARRARELLEESSG